MPRNIGTDTVFTEQVAEKAKVGRKYKRRSGFSSVRRICVACTTEVIHPNDAQYAGQVCFRCATEGLQPSGSPVSLPSSTAATLISKPPGFGWGWVREQGTAPRVAGPRSAHLRAIVEAQRIPPRQPAPGPQVILRKDVRP